MLRELGSGIFKVARTIDLSRPRCNCGFVARKIDLLANRSTTSLAVLTASGMVRSPAKHSSTCPAASDPYMGFGGYQLVELEKPDGMPILRNGEPRRFIAGWLAKVPQN